MIRFRHFVPLMLLMLLQTSATSAADGGDQAVGGSVTTYLSARQRDDVQSCRAGSDVSAALNEAARLAGQRGGGRVFLPDGCYRLKASIVLPANVELVGASLRGTKLMAEGDFPAILASGTYAAGLTGSGVRNMSIRCTGMANPNAMGVKFVYVNRGILADLYFSGCRHALDLYDQWQTRIDNISVDGQGAEQNFIGVYMGGPTDAANKAPNNAVVLSNTTMQNVAGYGYRLVFFAGSKFVNAEAMNGQTGWKLCGEAYIVPGQACQFGHFVNILADSTKEAGIVVDQGDNNAAVNNVMFDHVWIGNTRHYGLELAGVTFSQFDAIHVTAADNGVLLKNSQNVKLGVNVAGYNRNDDGSFAVLVSGGQANTVWATNSQSDHPTGYNGIAEIDGAANNAVWGGMADCSLSLAFGGKTDGTSYDRRSCRYEVQGRHVRVTFEMAIQHVRSGASLAQLTGLPFPVSAEKSSAGATGLIAAQGMTGLAGPILVQAVPGSSTAQLEMQGAANIQPLSAGHFAGAATIAGSIDYVRR